MAAEAFGQHYLTDMFAAGHTRTARASITDYWNAKVPMFFHNFKGFLAERLAYYINNHNWRGNFASVDYIWGKAKGTLESTLEEKGMPDFTFGDLVSGAVHDYDNKHGVDVTVDGADTTLYGDGSLGKGDTKSVAMKAVRAGVADIERAYKIAKGGGDAKAVIAALYSDGLFTAERFIPVVKPDSSVPASKQSIKWEQPTAFALLSDGKFQAALQILLKEKKSELAKVGASLEDAYKRTAFKEAVLPLLDGFKGVTTVNSVINWTPNTGGGINGRAQDDNANDYYKTAKKTDGGLKSLTYTQRVNLMVDLLNGATVGDDEDAVMGVLKSASKSDAKKLIKRFGWKYLYDKIDDGPGEDFKEAFPKSEYGS